MSTKFIDIDNDITATADEIYNDYNIAQQAVVAKAGAAVKAYTEEMKATIVYPIQDALFGKCYAKEDPEGAKLRWLFYRAIMAGCRMVLDKHEIGNPSLCAKYGAQFLEGRWYIVFRGTRNGKRTEVPVSLGQALIEFEQLEPTASTRHNYVKPGKAKAAKLLAAAIW